MTVSGKAHLKLSALKEKREHVTFFAGVSSPGETAAEASPTSASEAASVNKSVIPLDRLHNFSPSARAGLMLRVQAGEKRASLNRC